MASCAQPPVTKTYDIPRSAAGSPRERLQGLRAKEAATRQTFDPTLARPWLDVSGADPYRLVARGAGFLGLLRGSRALVELDADLGEVSRLLLREPPTALCVADDGSAWLGSRYGRSLVHAGADLRLLSTRELSVAGVADVACGDAGLVYVLPADGSPLLVLGQNGETRSQERALPGGLRLARRGRYLLESSLFERTVRVWQLSPRGALEKEVGRVVHDGALWAFDARERGDELLIAVAGVEDAPLVRVHGEFENVDSFLWLYALGEGRLRELARWDVSEQGLIVPKAVHLQVDGERTTVTTIAAGSGRWLRAEVGRSLQVETGPAFPGVTDAVFSESGEVSYASPLFDAWVRLDRGGAHARRVEPERRPELPIRLGEALFFTELIAPSNDSRGTHSRFSCETCHFEGSVDGRRHYTGRGDVSVVTKPLFGLANNRPHFSRALDPDLSAVSHNEFRVAGAGSGTDPWFELETARFPWLHELGVERAALAPLELREALVQFLYAFAPPPNPLTAGRARFNELEARGAREFHQRCASCHAPRTKSDDPQSEQRFEAWESFVFASNAPLVWARGDYAKTGVLPYVHERGTRIPSLRRLALKPRYFTNGSAPTLQDVLARYRDAGPQHGAETDSARLPALSPEVRRALLAFLRLL